MNNSPTEVITVVKVGEEPERGIEYFKSLNGDGMFYIIIDNDPELAYACDTIGNGLGPVLDKCALSIKYH